MNQYDRRYLSWLPDLDNTGRPIQWVTTITTGNATNMVDDEARIRQIVREEIAALPIKYDVPDTP
jgi:hypothetical protein